MAFSPTSITVAKGTIVTWTNKLRVMPLTITSDVKNLFTSGDMHKNDTFSHTFNKTGTFVYYSRHYDKMRGKVVVK